MTETVLQKFSVQFRKVLPSWLYDPIRSIGTVIIGPIRFGWKTGYFLSAFKMAAVARDGKPLPWYTYPCLDFLRFRDFKGKTILEFGGGQSTLWWANRAKNVITLEGDREWYEKIKNTMPGNVQLHYVSMESMDINVAQVKDVLKSKHYSTYDVIIIDGLYRYEMIAVALQLLAPNGIIVCDNSEGYDFCGGFKSSNLSRVDFFGNAPGVVLPHCTSIFFDSSSFVFNLKYTIPVIATS